MHLATTGTRDVVRSQGARIATGSDHEPPRDRARSGHSHPAVSRRPPLALSVRSGNRARNGT